MRRLGGIRVHAFPHGGQAILSLLLQQQHSVLPFYPLSPPAWRCGSSLLPSEGGWLGDLRRTMPCALPPHAPCLSSGGASESAAPHQQAGEALLLVR